jgi:hypothetical protein
MSQLPVHSKFEEVQKKSPKVEQPGLEISLGISNYCGDPEEDNFKLVEV